jgi:hypothetical protein
VGYYVEEWDFGVAENGSLTGSCTTDTFHDGLNACGTLRFPTAAASGGDPLNCTGSSPSNIDQPYHAIHSTIDAALSDASGAVTIRGLKRVILLVSVGMLGTTLLQ